MLRLLTTCLLLSLPLASQAGSPPALEDGPPPRPQLALYDSEHAFVAALLAWQREREALATRPPAPPPAVAEAHDWHHITGPEDIDKALENAAGFEQPHYEEPRRFNRSTHVSFPLPPLQAEQMADQASDPSAEADQPR